MLVYCRVLGRVDLLLCPLWVCLALVAAIFADGVCIFFVCVFVYVFLCVCAYVCVCLGG